MQAIADELGVDRKAINYHVSDRDGLRRLVATDVFEQPSRSRSPGIWRKPTLQRRTTGEARPARGLLRPAMAWSQRVTSRTTTA